MSADTSWAQGCNNRGGYPTEQAELIAELDAENVRLHGELIDVQCELATARAQLTQLAALAYPLAMQQGCRSARHAALERALREWKL